MERGVAGEALHGAGVVAREQAGLAEDVGRLAGDRAVPAGPELLEDLPRPREVGCVPCTDGRGDPAGVARWNGGLVGPDHRLLAKPLLGRSCVARHRQGSREVARGEVRTGLASHGEDARWVTVPHRKLDPVEGSLPGA